MIELFKLFMEKPVNGVLAAICVAVLATHLGLSEVKTAQATIIEQQRNDRELAQLVHKMHITLIRVDENVKLLKEEYKEEKEERDAN